jgi:bacillopeptidase F
LGSVGRVWYNRLNFPTVKGFVSFEKGAGFVDLKKAVACFVFVTVCLFSFVQAEAKKPKFPVPIFQVPAPGKGAAKIIKILRDKFADQKESPDAKKEYIVYHSDQLNTKELGKYFAEKRIPKNKRREKVLYALEFVRQQRKELDGKLREMKEKGKIGAWYDFLIENCVAVKTDKAGILELADLPEVSFIIEGIDVSSWTEITDGVVQKQAGESDPSENWALDEIGAPKAWAMGFTGEGVRVGSIDTGVVANHEQLSPNIVSGPSAWFDPVLNTAAPFDSAGHGTMTMGCAVGANVGGKKVGVAPKARWVSALGSYQNKFNTVFMLRCMDWMLQEGKPDVLFNSWSMMSGACMALLYNSINTLKAAEIFLVFSAGNGGHSKPFTDKSPANYVRLYPGEAPAFSVGGTNREKKLYQMSSVGPNSCSIDYVYPQVVAPGEELMVAFPTNPKSYSTVDGTSFSAAYVAGAAALLIESHPKATVDEIEKAFKETALDLGDPGPDNWYGYGLIQIPAAIEWLDKHAGEEDKHKK